MNKLSLMLSALTYLLLWVPVIILMLFSFSSNEFGMKWESFTLRWYIELFHHAEVQAALIRSLVIASITVVTATIVGALTAYGLYKYKFHGKKALRTTVLLPITMPYIVIGGSLLIFFTRVIHIPLGYPSILIAHFTFSVPIAVFVILGRMARIDWTLEEASADLGADKLTTWRKVTLPLLLPAVVASAALIFPWSFDDFTITYFVSGVGNATLPVYIFSQIRKAISPKINAIATIFVVLPIIGLLLMHFIQKKEVT